MRMVWPEKGNGKSMPLRPSSFRRLCWGTEGPGQLRERKRAATRFADLEYTEGGERGRAYYRKGRPVAGDNPAREWDGWTGGEGRYA